MNMGGRVHGEITAFAPGRVNLIGEHTDYNGGLALPFAISDGVTVRAVPSRDGRMHVWASDLDAHDSFDLKSPDRAGGWRAFARGAVAELSGAGHDLEAARLEVTGSVPRGSGLSSSAALEVALCLALLALSDSALPDRLDLAAVCSRIENDWVGARTGMLDQIASLFGEPDRALRIDFATLDVTPVDLVLGGFTLVTLDSGEQHANAGHGDDDDESDEDGYNQRRAECVRACELLGVETLSQATLEQADELPDPLGARARHVITENQRVRDAVSALEDHDLERVGELLNASHASLRDLYEISTPAVERTVQRLRDHGAIGARIMGGGFGGYVIGLLAPGARAPEDAIAVAPGPGARIVG
ncbi:MAG: galactokinase family protein [Solirubrobacteraceae bacterium]